MFKILAISSILLFAGPIAQASDSGIGAQLLRSAQAVGAADLNFSCVGSGEDITCACWKGSESLDWTCDGLDEKCKIINGKGMACVGSLCGCTSLSLAATQASTTDTDKYEEPAASPSKEMPSVNISPTTLQRIVDTSIALDFVSAGNLNYNCTGSGSGMYCTCQKTLSEKYWTCDGMEMACGLLVGKKMTCRSDGFCSCQNF